MRNLRRGPWRAEERPHRHEERLGHEQRAGEHDCACNQVLYNLSRRGPEFDLLPWMRQRGMPVMAYSPLEQGRLNHPGLSTLAAGRGVTAMQLALAWAMRLPDAIAIPKAATRDHIETNRAAADLFLSESAREAIDALFPAPMR